MSVMLATIAPNIVGTLVIAWFFVIYLRAETETNYQVLSTLKDHAAESQKKFQDQLDRLVSQQGQLMAGFRDVLADQRRSFRDELRHQVGVDAKRNPTRPPTPTNGKNLI
jgi:hypothetical protein